MCVAVDCASSVADVTAINELEYVRGRFRVILTDLNRGALQWRFMLPRIQAAIEPLLAELPRCSYEQLNFLGDLACYIQSPSPRHLAEYRARILDRLNDPRCPKIALTAYLEEAANVDDEHFRVHWHYLAP